MRTLSIISGATALLAACAGPRPAATAPAALSTAVDAPQQASRAPVASVPAPTYGRTDPRLSFFNDLNAIRRTMGVGALRQDPTLDAAAENHLGYMQANGIVAHTEVRGAKGYTHDDPYQQVIAAGGSNKQWVGQMAYRGEMGACLRSLANSIYHLQGITGNQETVGIAMRDDYCVANFAVVTAITDGGYGLAQWGGQQLATSASAYFPSDSAVVPGTFVPGNEIPNPAPDLETAGPPIMFRVNVETAADVLTVETFELRDRRDEPVPARILVSSDSKPGSAVVATEDARIFRGVAFLLPTKPVPAGTYTASFIGARNGVPIAKSWSFSAY